ncbi:short chain dehydrogenase/reductase [Aspergillus germanicus]
MESGRMVAIITGGVSGIGLAIARHVASAPGTHVYLLDLDVATGAKTINQLRAEFPEATFSFKECNVASWESQVAAFDQAYTEHGHIDLVVANAGIDEQESLTRFQGLSIQKPNLNVMDVNISGTIYSVQLGIYYLAKNKPTKRSGISSRGSIICTASCAGIYPFPTAPLYAASKHAVVGLVRSLARPLAKEDLQIQINAIAPGPVKTALSRGSTYYDMLAVTPMETLLRATATFIKDPSLSGQIAELHKESITYQDAPPFQHDETRQNIETFWKFGNV